MGKKTEEGTSSRRDFLKMATVSAPAAVAAVTMSGTGAAAAAQIDQDTSGLQDTAHTRAYFESAKF